jgi:tagatose 1,6-diphosphate aldolase
MVQFKKAVTMVLTKHSTAILMDPEFGLPALQVRAPGTGVLLAYEKTGYDTEGRQPACPTCCRSGACAAWWPPGANAIKILLYFNPAHPDSINTVKKAYIERIGAECAANDVPFFLEPICLRRQRGRRQERRVCPRQAQVRQGVHGRVLQAAVRRGRAQGRSAGQHELCGGTRHLWRHAGLLQARRPMALFREAPSVAQKPFIYLSAGVSDETFRETLELAAEAGTPFSGVLCGRATWQDGIPVYAQQGYDALVAWLEDRGVQNIEALNAVLAKGAKPWWDFYGGKGNIEVV